MLGELSTMNWSGCMDILNSCFFVKLRRRTPQQSWRGMQGAAAKLFEFE
jgi:hypothetical protein